MRDRVTALSIDPNISSDEETDEMDKEDSDADSADDMEIATHVPIIQTVAGHGRGVRNCVLLRIDMICLEDYYTILLLSYSISSGELGSPDLLLSYSMITLALHNTIILIITHKSFNP